MNGVWSPICNNCKKSEDIQVPSMRTIWNSALGDYPINMSEEVAAENIYMLDLSFGSKCNSKCMTCSPGCSNFWEDEWTHIWKIVPEDAVGKYGNPINLTVDDALLLAETYPNVRNISFIGGEPTILDEHFAFLKHLVDSGRSKNIKLSYVTNLTGISEELIALWETFEHVSCTVSIDGFGAVNEYIRYPIKWSKVETNLRMYLSLAKENPKFNVGLSCTMSIYNALHVDEMLRFWYNIIKEYGINTPSVNVNRAYHPQSANTSILPSSYKQPSINKLLNLKNHILSEAGMDISSFIERIDLLISWLSEENDIHADRRIREVMSFITASDKYRNRHIKDFIPELWDVLNK